MVLCFGCGHEHYRHDLDGCCRVRLASSQVRSPLIGARRWCPCVRFSEAPFEAQQLPLFPELQFTLPAVGVGFMA